MENALALINAIPFVLAGLMIFPAARETLKMTGLTWLFAGAMALMFGWLLTYVPEIKDGPVELVIEWVPSIGLSLSWYLDSLSLFFALIVTGVGIAVFFYSGYYLHDAEELARFYMYLGAFAGAMLALVLAGNIITLFIAWELTSITSFMLIGFKGDKLKEARVAASRALIVTGGGGLALLAGLLLLGAATNNIIEERVAVPEANIIEVFEDATRSNLDDYEARPLIGFQLKTLLEEEVGQALLDHPWYTAIVILIMIGAFSKSAQFPFHFWLPGAMTAPSPASAYLHSATMVKAGIYLLFRLYEPLGHSDLWMNGLMGVGLFTMLMAAIFALRQRDLKGLLAYSTVSKLGAIVALIGVPEEHGLKAAMVGIVAHATYKGTFFLLAGIIEHSTGTRNLDELGGLARRMPTAFVTAAVVGLSMAGVPPLIGFAAKEFLLDELLPYGPVGVIPVIVAFVASVLTVVAALLFVWDVFISTKNAKAYDHFHAPSPWLSAGPALLAGASIVLGIFIADLLLPLAKPLLGDDTKLYIIPPELNPAENTAFALSLAVLTLGPIVFALRRYWLTGPWINIRSGMANYAALIGGVEWTGDRLLTLQNGKLRYYLVLIMGVVSGLMFFGGYPSTRLPDFSSISGATDVLKIMLLGLTIGSTIAAIALREHLLAALAMGISGYAIGGIFLLEPAPDVALVQLLVETLATVLIILMIARISGKQRKQVIETLWRGSKENSNLGLYRDAFISIVIGVSVAMFALAAVGERDERLQDIAENPTQVVDGVEIREIARPINMWHLENAYKEIGVTDVVAAIVTDFRGTDTLLEIAVFSAAALGVLTLLTLPAGGELLEGKRITSVMQIVSREYGRDGDADDGPTPGTEAVEVQDKVAEGGVLSTPGLPEPGTVRNSRDPDDYGDFGDAYELPRLSTPLTRTAATLVLPFALLLSLAQVLYGGSGPGDGFTAGVVSGLAVALWYVVFGYFEARMRLRWLQPGRLVIAGLVIGFGNALLNLFVSGAFLRIIDGGDGPAGTHLASTLIFELAIYLTVFGGVTLIMEAIAHPNETDGL